MQCCITGGLLNSMRLIDTFHERQKQRYETYVNQHAQRIAATLNDALELDDGQQPDEVLYCFGGNLPRGTIEQYQADVLARIAEIGGEVCLSQLTVDPVLTDAATQEWYDAGMGHLPLEPVIAFRRTAG